MNSLLKKLLLSFYFYFSFGSKLEIHQGFQWVLVFLIMEDGTEPHKDQSNMVNLKSIVKMFNSLAFRRISEQMLMHIMLMVVLVWWLLWKEKKYGYDSFSCLWLL